MLRLQRTGTIDARQRPVAGRFVHIGTGLRTAALLQQPQAFPYEPRLAEIVLLGDPPAQGVVPVAENLPDGFAIAAL
ncbi:MULTISPECIES: hypothetical protein [Paracidovorax]|uniref:hypothetical protein n=1 Tax=Paracidovorax TaxID=3051137 RepID=UPI001CEFA30C|nr:hypothetical protein [Paracidovorax avenae]